MALVDEVLDGEHVEGVAEGAEGREETSNRAVALEPGAVDFGLMSE